MKKGKELIIEDGMIGYKNRKGEFVVDYDRTGLLVATRIDKIEEKIDIILECQRQIMKFLAELLAEMMEDEEK